MTDRISYNLAGAVEASGLSESVLKRAIRAGRLRAKRSSVDDDGKGVGNFVITHDALRAYIDSLVDA